MKTRLALVLLFALALMPASWAGKPKNNNNHSGDPKITEVSGASITVSVGSSGEQHSTFKISRDTKVTLNGVPVDAGELRAGMQAKIETGADKDTATAISATDPKRHPKGGRSAG